VLAAGRIHERDDAAEARRPLGGRDVAERLEEQGAPARVVEPRAAEPRRPHAGRAPERGHLDAGVVAERPRPGEPRGGARLQERVGAVRVARLLGKRGARQLGEHTDLVGNVAQVRGQLARLREVQRREDQTRPRG